MTKHWLALTTSGACSECCTTHPHVPPQVMSCTCQFWGRKCCAYCSSAAAHHQHQNSSSNTQRATASISSPHSLSPAHRASKWCRQMSSCQAWLPCRLPWASSNQQELLPAQQQQQQQALCWPMLVQVCVVKLWALITSSALHARQQVQLLMGVRRRLPWRPLRELSGQVGHTLLQLRTVNGPVLHTYALGD